MFIEIIKKNDDSRKVEPEVGENVEAGELEVEYFDIFPTRSKLAYHKNEEDKRKGVEYVMSKILGFYKECLELGPEYLTGVADEGEVTNIFKKNEEDIFTDAGDGVRINPDGKPMIISSLSSYLYCFHRVNPKVSLSDGTRFNRNSNSRSDGDIDVSSKGLMLQQQVLSKDVAAEAAYQLKEKFKLSGTTVDYTGHGMREIRKNSRIDGIRILWSHDLSLYKEIIDIGFTYPSIESTDESQIVKVIFDEKKQEVLRKFHMTILGG
ncbi:hypothetical protein Tco_1192847 [Tanacetum coccineum]